MKVFTQRYKSIFFLLILLSGLCIKTQAAPGDTTWITTFDHEFQNWADVHYANFVFPDTSHHVQKILMFYTIGCPSAGCDPWDRLGWIKAYTDTVNHVEYEIARVVTPFNIVGGGYPGTCTFAFDLTDYMPILHDTVRLGSYIESWIGGTRGWLVTARFAFIEGEAYYKPFKIINLWQDHHIVYGDTANPHEDHLPPMTVMIDPETAKVKARITTTGHGQGNTSNACEFVQKLHYMIVGNDTMSHFLWRTCSANPCSPQGGTWQYARAGWCPGSGVIPWDLDVTSSVNPGQNVVVNYNIEDYLNECRPTNPNCISGVTCPDCNYNNNGHTEPFWTVESQLILYKINPNGVKNISSGIPSGFTLNQNYPNPFNPSTNIGFALVKNSHVKITVYDAIGKEIEVLIDKQMQSGVYNVEFDASRLPSGVYLYKMEAKDFSETKKMILIK